MTNITKKNNAMLSISNMTGIPHDPKWSLERRESSGQLVWRKESPSSKIRFRFDVEVLEFEKQPHEDIEHSNEEFSVGNIASTIVLCASCVVVVAVSVFLPWYLMEKALSTGS
ncbi:uncharacterized protein LOC129243582 isoform X2 [Anastrepha obliqua]|uniref:uncharacterized protein LOC129243582 isoform X2 n=1 Tax=Anastrepha obliqua TaxID=95512 RepID=UPI002409354E|nr:uncharacterized protein LOC129243582 isoform X2 [Anastrepha obliqua]